MARSWMPTLRGGDREPGSARPEQGSRSAWAIRALLLYIVLLPVHSLVIAILLTHAGVPLPALRVLAAWKEVLLLATLAALIGGVVVGKTWPRLVWIDWISLAWLGQVLLYFALRDLLFDGTLGLEASLYGARDWVLYVLPYFIGRLIVVSERDLRRVFVALLAMGAVTSGAGILEYLFVPTYWHLEIGIPTYFSEFLNLHYPTTWGLPPNYWQSVGNDVVRRAVSVHLSAQAFALPFLLLWPLGLLNLLARRTAIGALVVALNAVALTLTFTRMTIVVCFLQGLLVLWVAGRRRLLLPYLAVSIIASAFVLTGWIPLRVERPARATPETGSIIIFRHLSIGLMVRNTATLQDSSSKVRPGQWVTGLGVLRDHPAGMGLGSTGNTAGRLGAGGMGNEAGYLKVTGALGFPGLLIFLGWFLGIVVSSRAVSREEDGPWRQLAILTLAAAVGYLINNVTAPPDQSLFVSYVFPWLAGMTVQRWARLRALATT